MTHAQWLFGLALLAGVASQARAQDQVEILDVTYTATAANTENSHYYVDLSGGPADWRAPVDYASGRVHARLEVLSKPSDEPTLYNICFEGTPSYACMPYSPTYTEPGVYDFEYPFSAFYQNDMVDWEQGIDRMFFVLKDEEEGIRNDDPLYYPTEIRITMTLVAPGATYEPPVDEPDAGPDPEEPEPVADAGVDPTGGTGGVAETGGAGGESGAPASGGSGGAAAPGGTGGMSAPGGTAGNGGAMATGGMNAPAVPVGSGGAALVGGRDWITPPDDNGCSVARVRAAQAAWLQLLALGMALLGARALSRRSR